MAFEKLKNNLEKKGYMVKIFSSSDEAAEYIDGEIDNKTVGIGGSMTVKQMGLYDKLRTHNEVFWHSKIENGMSKNETIFSANSADIYISSANAVAETGEIINIDGVCNRVSSICYGHEKVIFVIGRNKLAKNYDEALFRARNISAPKNAKRLGKKHHVQLKQINAITVIVLSAFVEFFPYGGESLW